VIRRWYCPECKLTSRTEDDGTGQRYHICRKLRGLSVPMVLEGVKARIVLREREDYVNGDAVQLDPERHRPVMSIDVVRENGNDSIVLAPTATAKGAT